MPSSHRRRIVLLGLLLAGSSFVPAPAQPPPPRSALAEARYQAALRQYDLVWSYYQQARIDSYQVYVWSRLVLDSRQAMIERPADRITAIEAHLDRMKKLEGLIQKVRRLGFGLSYDVGATEYYRLEAELWLTEARDRRQAPAVGE